MNRFHMYNRNRIPNVIVSSLAIYGRFPSLAVIEYEGVPAFFVRVSMTQVYLIPVFHMTLLLLR